MNKRQYIPEIGKLVKLASWNDYRTFAPSTEMWAWFQVQGLKIAGDEATVRIQHYNAGTLGESFQVPLSAIDTPIGWKERYTITVTPDKVATVLSWFSRGITVRQSHYIPDCSTAFQPMDNDNTPDWKFNGDTVVDRIPPEQCPDVFRVVKLETEYDVGIPAPCPYCKDGKRTPENNPVLLGQDKETCPHCGIIAGFSFDKPYHARVSNYGVNPTREQLSKCECSRVRQAGECWVCDGTGIGKKYLSELSRKDRQQAIKAMHNDGWTVHYIRRGGPTWMRERETVVKEWGQAVPELTEVS